jgi:A/G-specific adenine glycosylase
MPALARSARTAVDNTAATRENLRKSLLSWYDREGRSLPWRVRGGRADPYRVWLSEVMLQQTTVAAVIPYFARFLERWPTVKALAAAPREDVLGAWAGLGYYSRARNLHTAAQRLAADGVPDTEAGWRALPGVGPYTAAAIAAIAFDEPTNVVDGNVERVMARLHAVETPLPAAKPELRALAAALTPTRRPGDYAQAVMDLGATVCTPRAPACGRCPWATACQARALGLAAELPRRAPKPAKPVRRGIAYLALRDRSVLIETRPPHGLLGGMLGLPCGDWAEGAARPRPPFAADWRPTGAEVRHTFTHFHLLLSIEAAQVPRDFTPPAGRFQPLTPALETSLPTVMRKALRLGLDALAA